MTASRDSQKTPDVLSELARTWGARQAWLVALPACELAERAIASPDALLAMPLDGMPIGCVDIRALGKQARERGMALVVDDTLPGMEGCPAARLGAHVAFAAITDRLCAVAVSRDADQALEGIAGRITDMPQAVPAQLEEARRLLDEAARAWQHSSDVAQVTASYLACHPRVAEVRYPGLKADPSFAVAARTLQRGFGPVVDMRLHGERRWRRHVCAAEDPRVHVMRLEGQLSLGQTDALAL